MRFASVNTEKKIMRLISTNRTLHSPRRTPLSGKRALRGCDVRLCPSPASPVTAYISFPAFAMSVSDILAYEQGELTDEETYDLFQRLIDDGSVWKLQGSYGRLASDLIAAGYCMLGPVGHHDYWGNYVPSRFEVKPGTKGSPQYVEETRNRMEAM